VELVIENKVSKQLGCKPVVDKYKVSFHVWPNAHHGTWYQVYAAFSLPGVMQYKFIFDLAQRTPMVPRRKLPVILAAPKCLVTFGNLDIWYQVRGAPLVQRQLAVKIENGVLKGIKRCRLNPGQKLKLRWSLEHPADAAMGFIQVEFYKEKTKSVNVNLWSSVRGVKKQRSAKGAHELLAAVLEKTA